MRCEIAATVITGSHGIAAENLDLIIRQLISAADERASTAAANSIDVSIALKPQGGIRNDLDVRTDAAHPFRGVAARMAGPDNAHLVKPNRSSFFGCNNAQQTQEEEHIDESTQASVNCDFKQE